MVSPLVECLRKPGHEFTRIVKHPRPAVLLASIKSTVNNTNELPIHGWKV